MPWLANRWNAALAAVTTYRHTWRIDGTDDPGLVGLLGPEPLADSDQHRDWMTTRKVVLSHALEITRRLLADTGWQVPETPPLRVGPQRRQPGRGDELQRDRAGESRVLELLRSQIEHGAIDWTAEIMALDEQLTEDLGRQIVTPLLKGMQRRSPGPLSA